MQNASSSAYLRASVTIAMLGVIAELIGYGWNLNVPPFGTHMNEAWKSAQYWQAAAHIQFVHALVLYYLAGKQRINVWYAMFAGVIGFSGGFYLLATTGHENFEIIAVSGALTLVVAWGALALGDL